MCVTVTEPLRQTQFSAKDGICAGEKKQSVVTRKRGTRTGEIEEKDLKESGRKQKEVRQIEMFNLAQCSTETLNLLRLLRKVKAGQHRMCYLTRQGSYRNKLLCVCVSSNIRAYKDFPSLNIFPPTVLKSAGL